LLGFDNCFSVSSNGQSGGLALFWQNSFSCTVLNYFGNHISVEVDDLSKGKWQFTGYYGFSEGRRRRASWNFMRNLVNNISLPWCILGDFNDIFYAREKRGGAPRPRWLINGFRKSVLDLMERKLSEWKGRVVLINSVLSSLPLYFSFHSTKLPKRSFVH